MGDGSESLQRNEVRSCLFANFLILIWGYFGSHRGHDLPKRSLHNTGECIKYCCPYRSDWNHQHYCPTQRTTAIPTLAPPMGHATAKATATTTLSTLKMPTTITAETLDRREPSNQNTDHFRILAERMDRSDETKAPYSLRLNPWYSFF